MSTTTVLVIEDEPDLARLYSTWLSDEYAVRTAFGGSAGLDELDSQVDIVLLDRRMPDLSGDAVLERIQDRHPNCRVAMVTAVEPDFDIIEMDLDEYLIKPVTYEELVQLIEGLETRREYDDRIDEYLTLVKKKNTLETGKPDPGLTESPKFQRLEQRVADLEETVDTLRERFDHSDTTAIFRDL